MKGKGLHSKYEWNRFTSVGAKFLYEGVTRDYMCTPARSAGKTRGWKFKLYRHPRGVVIERVQ